MQIAPFQIDIPGAQIDALNARLQATRWPDQYDGMPWAIGTDRAYLQALVQYWMSAYDWRAAQRALNLQPQFVATVGGLRIHFLHRHGVVPVGGPKPYPLVITHGWPGSFIEFGALLRHLCDPASVGADPADAFDVVVPSMPGFGFSQRPAAPGTSIHSIASLWAELMSGLGYEHFGAQGGDLGAAVSIALASRHAARVDGIHLNYLPGSFAPPQTPDDAPVTQAEREFIAAKAAWADSEGAYAHQHSTKPQTLAFALNDSPVGLAAWIVEKFRAWSDCGGDVESVFSRDDLLTNLSLYWHTQTIGSSMRLYWEARMRPLRFATGERVQPPVGFARFPKEISQPPRSWLERVFNVLQWTDMPRGGHFAAMEQPALLAEDIRRFFRPLRG
ncbi:epoxide hydrolase family protein [Paraburkholderia rhizosphaerae]|uniref:Pimeloyl-ACP methyl ester carboxylesterase n=1 Tax=Paraburkholderia rhizosphaerae TaxID=480658 RepID=A0A4R8L3F4_9BURK|nr:epoxide hydrolase family protein [Paraburkholderia rhizosphaerae]TDY37076.1 pimeloyl-ACP methyl ester carboxylesterase [Paraburkholderia rhizosphaerae]